MKDFRVRSRRSLSIVAALVLNELATWLLTRHSPHRTFALYVDPGSGLLMWQLLAATAAGFVFNMRDRIAQFIKNIRSSSKG